jgi:ABC-type glycerol-3-phosphate transport system permease component
VIPGVLAGVLWKNPPHRKPLRHRQLLPVAGWCRAAAPDLFAALALASVIVANVWRGCAFSMILLYAGLQRVPRELHEAADLEGVSAWQRLRWLLIPQLAPVIALNLVLITIASFNTFDLIIPLTGGGPARGTEVISLFMYRLGFFDLEAGRAAAVAVVMLAVNLTLAWIAGRLIARETPREPGCGRAMIASPRRRIVFIAGLTAAAAAFLLPQLWLFSLSLKSKAGRLRVSAALAAGPGVARQLRVRADAHAGAVVSVEQRRRRAHRGRPDDGRGGSRRLRAVARALRRPTPLMAGLLAVQMISPVILLVPIYGVVERLGLIDTRAGLVLVLRGDAGAVHGLGVEELLRRGAGIDFRSGAPRRRVAGADAVDVRLPIVAPGLGAAAIFNLAAYWSEFCLALVLLDRRSASRCRSAVQLSKRLDTDWQLLAAASFIALVPVLARFVFLAAVLRRAALTAGAVKG